MSEKPDTDEPNSRQAGWDAGRLDALVDGTIAIVLTLIVFDLKVPMVPEGEAALPRAVLRMWPTFCCYLMAFLSAGMLWVGHRSQFHFIRRTTRHQLWMNLLFLLWVSLMPFSTALITAHPGHWLPAMLYGVDVSLAGIILQWNWRYACKRPHLFGIVPKDSVRKGLVRRLAIGQMAYAVGIVLAPVSGWLSIGIYLLVPTLYLLPSALDQRWHVEPDRTDK